jgi:N-acetylglutamate synthase-like GNAT family acetyltransferase
MALFMAEVAYKYVRSGSKKWQSWYFCMAVYIYKGWCIFMNLKSGSIEGFEGYSHFKSVKEFNTHIEMWLAVKKQEFSKGEFVGLKRLVRFSAKIPGVSNAKIGTMLKAINEEYKGNGISRSTFKRMIMKAKEIGILTIYETERKNGSQSSNLYSFNRFPISEPPEAEKLNHSKETNNLLKTNHQKSSKRNEAPIEIDHTFVSDKVPQAFVRLVKHFFSDANTIEEYWHMVQIAAFRFECNQQTEDVLAIAIQSFKQLIRKLKSTKQVEKPIAFFYGILTNKLKELYLDQLPKNRQESKPSRYVLGNGEVMYYDWLHTVS